MADCGTLGDLTPTRTFLFRSVALSHEGRVRPVNEDAFLDRSDAGVWAVADGMGGHAAGDYASRLVVDRLERGIAEAGGAPSADEIAAVLDSCNAELLAYAERADRAVVGSTVAVLAIAGPGSVCVWAGDSRVYRLRGGALLRLTRDHSYVQGLVDAGVLDPALAEGHPKANVITRAVGAVKVFQPDAVADAVMDGDLFLLCSDGLTRVVRDEEIAAALRDRSIDDAGPWLLNTALERGARDNVTLVVVRCEAVIRR